MKLKKFNEIHFQGGNYENGDSHSYTQVDDTTIKSEVNNELLEELIQASKHVQLLDRSEIEVVKVDDLRHILEKYNII
jgi:hypothetical protein